MQQEYSEEPLAAMQKVVDVLTMLFCLNGLFAGYSMCP